jgi:hypothetical protein
MTPICSAMQVDDGRHLYLPMKTLETALGKETTQE